MKGMPVLRPLIVALALFGMTAATASASGDDNPSLVAAFEGGWIRLADGWGEAQACTSDGLTTECYRTEAEMDAAGSVRALPSSVLGLLVECPTPTLKLYRAGSYGGNVLQLTTRGTLFNLSLYGFDNDTSSYKIGPCAATFFDTNSGGTLYPGSTAANVWSPSMAALWDNRVGSVYIS